MSEIYAYLFIIVYVSIVSALILNTKGIKNIRFSKAIYCF